MIQLVMSDLDGTLLTNDKQVSKTTIEAIVALKEKGIKFGIATGRSLVAVEKLAHTWGIANHCDVMMGMNGSQFLDMKTGKMKVTHQLPGKVILDVIEKYRHLNVNFGVYDGNVLYTLKEERIARNLATNNGFEMIVTDFTDVATRPHSKLIILTPPEEMANVQAFYESHLSKEYRGFQSDKHLFEIVDPNISKSFGIQKICEHFGLTMDQVMAFGDNDNDIEMIRDVGIGVCMANGTDKAKEVASAFALSNEEDGLANFIFHYLAKVGG